MGAAVTGSRVGAYRDLVLRRGRFETAVAVTWRVH